MNHTPLPRVTSLHPPGYDPQLPRRTTPTPTPPGLTVTTTSLAVDVETLTRRASEGPPLSFIPHIRMDELPFDMTSPTSSSSTLGNPRYTYQILQARTGWDYTGPPKPPILHLDCTTTSQSKRFAFGPDEVDLATIWKPMAWERYMVNKRGDQAMINTWHDVLSHIVKADVRPRFQALNYDHFDYEPDFLYYTDGIPNMDFGSESAPDEDFRSLLQHQPAESSRQIKRWRWTPEGSVLVEGGGEEKKLVLDSYKLVVPILQGFAFIGRDTHPHHLGRGDINHVPLNQLTRLQLRNVLMTMGDCLEIIWRCPRLESLALSGVIHDGVGSEDCLLASTPISTVVSGIRHLEIADRCDVDIVVLFEELSVPSLETLRLSVLQESLQHLPASAIQGLVNDSWMSVRKFILPETDGKLGAMITEAGMERALKVVVRGS
ncbi:hypothetical protein E1B28_011751 [Marasmius oreades]|uniref:Uncharacterized protein n=1 Tax=Marasmius oreades TaxID=181124 RepID=A0A9P7RVD2_9AGAR|nr:uncharacterized protein E1B28_011751 [Marasmius oreades]KAG7090143.1 hypothetical protein E1B28_011751 [Marasmius oreades]